MPASRGAFSSLVSGEDASNVLVLAPSFHSGTRECCSSLLEAAAPGDLGVIPVLFSRTPDQWLRDHREALDDLPAHLGFVSVGAQTRSVASQAGDVGGKCELPLPGASGAVHTVPSPNNLTALGVQLTETLDEVAGRDGIAAVSLCVRSLSPLLMHAEPATVFRFLHVLTGRVGEHDALAHYHLDPAAHGEEVIAQLRPLFDAVVELSDGEPPTVTTA